MALSIQYAHPKTWNAKYDNDHKLIEITYIDSETLTLFTVKYNYNDKGLLTSTTSTESAMNYNCYYDETNRVIRQVSPTYYNPTTGSNTTKDDDSIPKPFFPSLMTEFDVIYDDDGQPFYLDPYHTRVLPIGNSKFYDETKSKVVFTASILDYYGDNDNIPSDITGYIFKNGKKYLSVDNSYVTYYGDDDNYVKYQLDSFGVPLKSEMIYDKENGTATLTKYTFIKHEMNKEDVSVCMVDLFSDVDSIILLDEPYTSSIEQYKLIGNEYRLVSRKSYNSDGSNNWEDSYNYTYYGDLSEKYPSYNMTTYDESGNEIPYEGVFEKYDSKNRCIQSRYYDTTDMVWDDRGTYDITYTDNDDGSYVAKKIYYLANGTPGVYLTSMSSLPSKSDYYINTEDINVFATNTRAMLQSLNQGLSNAVSTEKIIDVLKIPDRILPYNSEFKYDKDGNILYIHIFKNAKNELQHQACVDITRDSSGRISVILYYNEDGTINPKISRTYSYNDDGTIDLIRYIGDNGVIWSGSCKYIYNIDGIEGFNGCKRFMYNETHCIFNLSQATYESENVTKKRYFNIDGSICWTTSYDIEDGKTYRFDPEGNRFRFDVTDDGFIIGDETITAMVDELNYRKNSNIMVNTKTINSICDKYGFDYYYNKVIAKLENGRQVCETYSANPCHIFIIHSMDNKVDVCICCNGTSEQFNIDNIFVNFYDSHDIKYINLAYRTSSDIIELSPYISHNIVTSLKYDDEGNILERIMLNSTDLNNLYNVTYNYYEDKNYMTYPSFTKEYWKGKLINYTIYGSCNIYDLQYYPTKKCAKYTYDGDNLIDERLYQNSSTCILDPKNVISFNDITKYTYTNGLLKTSRYYGTDDSGDPIWTDYRTCDYYYSEDEKLTRVVRFKSETESYEYTTYEYNDNKTKISENSTGNYTLKYNDGVNDIEERYTKYTNSSSNTEDFYVSYVTKYLNDVKISEENYNIDSSTGTRYPSWVSEYMSDGSNRRTKYIGYGNKGVLSGEYLYYLGDEYKCTSYKSDGSISQYYERFKENTYCTKINKSSYVDGIPTRENHMDYPWGKQNSIDRDSNGDITSSYIYTYNEDGELLTYTNLYHSSSDGSGYEQINEYDPYYHKNYYKASYKKYKSMTEVDWTNSETKAIQTYYLLRKDGDVWTYENKVTKYKEDGTPYVYKVNELEYNESEDIMDSISLKYYDEDGNFVPISSEGRSCERCLMPDGTYIWKYYTEISDGIFGKQWTMDADDVINEDGYVEKRNCTYLEDPDGVITKTINWASSTDIKYDKFGNIIDKKVYKSDGSISNQTIYKYDNKNRLISCRLYNSDGTVNWNNSYDQSYDKFGNIIDKKVYKSDGSLNYTNMYNCEWLDYGIVLKKWTFDSNGSIKNQTGYEYDITNGQYIKASSYNIIDGKKEYIKNSSSTIRLTQKAEKDLKLSTIYLYTTSVYDYDNSIDDKFGFSRGNSYTIEHDDTKLTIHFIKTKSSYRWYSDKMTLEYTDINNDKVVIIYSTSGTNQTFVSKQVIRISTDGSISSRYYKNDETTIDWTNDLTYDITIHNDEMETKYLYNSNSNRYCYSGIDITKKSDTLIEQRYYNRKNIVWGCPETCDIYTTVGGKVLYRVVIYN